MKTKVHNCIHTIMREADALEVDSNNFVRYYTIEDDGSLTVSYLVEDDDEVTIYFEVEDLNDAGYNHERGWFTLIGTCDRKREHFCLTFYNIEKLVPIPPSQTPA